MKRFFALVLLFCHCIAHGQDGVASTPIALTFNKTTSLIFAAPVKAVNLGSSEVSGQLLPGMDSILQLRANRRDFAETSLSVATEDGHFFSFLLKYESNPSVIVLRFGRKDVDRDPESGKSRAAETFPEWKKTAYRLLIDSTLSSTKHFRKESIEGRFYGFYIKGSTIYCKIRLLNRSHLPGEYNLPEWTVQDRHPARKGVFQQWDLPVRKVAGTWDKLQPGKWQSAVFALAAKSLPRHKSLALDIREKSGARDLHFELRSTRFNHPRQLDEGIE